MKDDTKLSFFFFFKLQMTITCNTANIKPVFLVGLLFYPTDCKQKVNSFFFGGQFTLFTTLFILTSTV